MSFRRYEFSNSLNFFSVPFLKSEEVVQNTAKKTNAKCLDEMDISDDDIPEEYIDHYFEFEIMDEPVQLDGRHVMDFLNLQKWWQKSGRDKINPVTNKPYETFVFLPELKDKINKFVELKIKCAKELAKSFEDKIKQLQQKNLQDKLIREKLIDQFKKQRQELTNKIEISPEELDEHTLKQLLNNIDRIDKKINKIMLGPLYHHHPHHLKERIIGLINKRDHHGHNEKDEQKLKKLFNQLEGLTKNSHSFLTRYHPNNEPTDDNNRGLLSVNQAHTRLLRRTRDWDF